MSNWKSALLGEACEILDNQRVPLNDEQRFSMVGDVPYYGANGVVGHIDRFMFNEPLILLAEDGGNFDEYETRPIAYRIDGKSWVNNHAHVLRSKPEFVQDFVFYALQHKDIRSFIKGGTRTKLNQSDLRAIRFDYPSDCDTQRTISRVLGTIDTLIEQTEALIEKHQQIEHGMLHDLLARGVDSKGHLRPVHRDAPECYKDTKAGIIPKEWRVMQLSEIAFVDRGKFTHRPRNDERFYNGPYPFIQTGDVTASLGRYLYEASQSLNERGLSVSKEFPIDTIAVTVAANIADTTILAVPMCFPDSVVGVVVHAPNNTRFVELVLRRYKPDLNSKAPQSAQKNINLNDLRPLLIPMPPVKEQLAIAQHYEANASFIEHNTDELKKLLLLKSGLMQDLLSSRLPVNHLVESMNEKAATVASQN